jgi:site-specific DNA recombinase
MKCVIYTRVSTNKQVQDGISLESQEIICKKFATDNGYEVLKTFSDAGKSGTSLKHRTALLQALDIINDKIYLLVYSLSRFTRNAEDFADLRRVISSKNSKLMSVSENFNGKEQEDRFVTWLHAILAQKETDLISQRTKAVLEYRKNSKGSSNNVLQYGWTYRSDIVDSNGKLIPVKIKEEQEVIKTIMDIYRSKADKKITYQKIADILNDKGVETRKKFKNGIKCKWHGRHISRIVNWQLQNENSELHKTSYEI